MQWSGTAVHSVAQGENSRAEGNGPEDDSPGPGARVMSASRGVCHQGVANVGGEGTWEARQSPNEGPEVSR